MFLKILKPFFNLNGPSESAVLKLVRVKDHVPRIRRNEGNYFRLRCVERPVSRGSYQPYFVLKSAVFLRLIEVSLHVVFGCIADHICHVEDLAVFLNLVINAWVPPSDVKLNSSFFVRVCGICTTLN